MFRILKKFLNKQLGLKSFKGVSETVQGNYILITFYKKDKEPYIKLNVSDLSDEACNQYAETLFNLNSGRYHQSFLDLLLDMSYQDFTINRFIQNIIVQWSYLIKTTSKEILSDNNSKTIENSNKPIVSPTDFNKHAK